MQGAEGCQRPGGFLAPGREGMTPNTFAFHMWERGGLLALGGPDPGFGGPRGCCFAGPSVGPVGPGGRAEAIEKWTQGSFHPHPATPWCVVCACLCVVCVWCVCICSICENVDVWCMYVCVLLLACEVGRGGRVWYIHMYVFV